MTFRGCSENNGEGLLLPLLGLVDTECSGEGTVRGDVSYETVLGVSFEVESGDAFSKRIISDCKNGVDEAVPLIESMSSTSIWSFGQGGSL